MALALLATVLVGFSRRTFLRAWFPEFPAARPGGFMTVWPLAFFGVQDLFLLPLVR